MRLNLDSKPIRRVHVNQVRESPNPSSLEKAESKVIESVALLYLAFLHIP